MGWSWLGCMVGYHRRKSEGERRGRIRVIIGTYRLVINSVWYHTKLRFTRTSWGGGRERERGELIDREIGRGGEGGVLGHGTLTLVI